ncbi:MAG: ferrous iron transport protein A [Promethearchaeota archaeon]
MPEEVTPVLDESEAKRLASVSPGTRCVLLGIEGIRGSRHVPHRRGRRQRMHFRDVLSATDDCRFRHSRKERGRSIMRRLLDLGITRGCTFMVVQGGGQGPVLIEVRGTRIALGHHMACRILVREVP